MLVISRKANERIKIGDNIEVVICKTGGKVAKVGIRAPKHVTIRRAELKDKKVA